MLIDPHSDLAGRIALAYQGTADGTNFNGYITSTVNALAKSPIYRSATVNDPAEPLVNGSNTQTFGDRILYLTDVIGPDGSVWAGVPLCRDRRLPRPATRGDGAVGAEPLQKEVRSRSC
jgi:hypothetical protein